MEVKKKLNVQRFDSPTQRLTELVKLWEQLETAKDIFHTQGEGHHQNKKTKQSSERHQYDKLTHIKKSNQTAKPSEEDANKKIKIKTTCVPSAWNWTQCLLM